MKGLVSTIAIRPHFASFNAVEPGGSLGFDRPWLNSHDWICESSDTGPKETFEAANRHRDSIDEIMGALNLTSPGKAQFQLLLHRHSWVFGGPQLSSRNVSPSGGTGDNVTLVDTGVDEFIGNFNFVKRIIAEPRLERLKLPFRRLRLAAERKEDEDRVVDYAIGLERLLAPDTESLEVTFRFRLRGAAVLPESFGDSDARKRFMANLYRLRSRVVHGRADRADVEVMTPQAESALIATLLWFGRVLSADDATDPINELDRAMIAGGAQWARKNPS